MQTNTNKYKRAKANTKRKQTNKQTNKHTNKDKQTKKQTKKGKQTNKQTNRQDSKREPTTNHSVIQSAQEPSKFRGSWSASIPDSLGRNRREWNATVEPIKLPKV